MTLGDFITILESQVANGAGHLPVRFDHGGFPAGFASWRGRYEEVTIDWYEDIVPPTGDQVLAQAKATCGAVLDGYKGGSYRMGLGTPLWADQFGYTTKDIPISVAQLGDELVIYTHNIWDYA